MRDACHSCRTAHGETLDQLRADAEAPDSAKVSDLAETPDRRSPILGSTTDRATAGYVEQDTTETCGPVLGRVQETCAQHSDDSQAGEYTPSEPDTPEESSAVNPIPDAICDDVEIGRAHV